MYCPNCGAEIPDGNAVCPKCGVPTTIQNAAATAMTTQNTYNGSSGFVCGLLGFLLDWVPIAGLVLSIIGVSQSSKSLRAHKNNAQIKSSKGLSTAGLILGIIGLITSIGFLIYEVIVGILLGGGFFSIYEDLFDMLDF